MTKRVESERIISKLFDEFEGCVESLRILDDQSVHLEGIDNLENENAADEFRMRLVILAQAMGCFAAADLSDAQHQFYALIELLEPDEGVLRNPHEKLIYLMLNSIAAQLERASGLSRSKPLADFLLPVKLSLRARLTEPAATTRKAA